MAKLRKWYRYTFADGSIIYLPKKFTSVKILCTESKLHGKIIAKRFMGERKIET